ncbi:hypothetical protein evm_007168 [Chilo suppressalis]|uniref:Allatostatin C n=1 Tax=Chilo suppressalis TaxID=168631 RepID=A0A0S1U0F0_CHISP|nr:allatostatin C precursor [Chilo suppressalis]RVE48214.1 hypothetical protein evm_007168 [Chilo suppressalis]
MKPSSLASSTAALMAIGLSLLFVTVLSAPMESEEEQSENSIVVRPDNVVGLPTPWDAIDAAALRKLLIQLDAEERMNRVSRSWPQSEPRWGLRSMEGRLARPWRADKRQVRFRQCYFNPISCFRK